MSPDAMLTEPCDVSDRLREVVYNQFTERDAECSANGTGSNDMCFRIPAYICAEPQKIANEWNAFIENVYAVAVNQPFPLPDSGYIKYQPALPENVFRFCLEKDIVYDCFKYMDLLKRFFYFSESIEVLLSEDNEIHDYIKIRYIVHTRDSIENVLAQEKELKKELKEAIPRGLRQFFTYNYNLI